MDKLPWNFIGPSQSYERVV